MDNISAFNQARWNDLVKHNVACSKPILDITEEQAKSCISNVEYFGDLSEKTVLCLASGGGQQSVSFAKLGSQVTVTDLSDAQLAKDRLASVHNKLSIRIIQADMRDFSHFQAEEFDIIHQPYSINYVPDVNPVFDGIASSLRSGGMYYLMFHNPITHGSWTNGSWGAPWPAEELWRSQSYPVRLPYQEGIPIRYEKESWIYTDIEGKEYTVPGPQEFKHTFSTIFNGLISRGLQIKQVKDMMLSDQDETLEVGSWEHYQAYTAPWFEIWAQKG